VSFCSIDELITQIPNSGIENQNIPGDENQEQNESFDFGDSSTYEEIDNENGDIEDIGNDSKKPEENLDPRALEFVNYSIISKREINFIFSKSVKLDSVLISPYQEIKKIDEGSIITIHFKEDIIADTDFIIDLCVADKTGNKLNVQSPFYIDNWDVQLIINEIFTEYSGSTKRTEFIEFRIIKPGNLEGIKVFCASYTTAPMIYEFPAVNVRLNEYVVLHTRMIEDTCLDELGEDLAKSGGRDSCPTARDLWISGSKKLLHKYEVVYVLDKDDKVLDTVMLADGPDSWNKKTYLFEAAEFLLEQNAWYFAEGRVRGAADAVDCSSIGGATTKSVSRDEARANTRGAGDWFVTASTPGLLNSKRP
jgi:hypothetical protein